MHYSIKFGLFTSLIKSKLFSVFLKDIRVDYYFDFFFLGGAGWCGVGLSIFGLKKLFFMCECKYSRMKLNPTQCSNVYTVKHFNKKIKKNKNTLFFHREINASQLLNIEKVYELVS